MTGIKPTVTDEMIAKVADVLDSRSRHGYRIDTDTSRPYCVCGWRAEERYSAIAAYARHIARAALEAAAPLIAAKAWDEGHRTPQKREMDDCQCSAWSSSECACGKYGTGKLITPNPYRKDS